MSWVHASNNKEWSVYVIGEEWCDHGPVKIGTATNVGYRIAGLQGGNHRRLVIYGVARVAGRDAALKVERDAHLNFGDRRLPGRDWVNCSAEEAIAFLEAHSLVLGVVYGAD